MSSSSPPGTDQRESGDDPFSPPVRPPRPSTSAGQPSTMPNPAKATTEAGNEARKAETVDAAEILVEVALHGQPGVGKTHVLASLFDWIAASNGFIVTDFVASEHFLELYGDRKSVV